MARKRLTPIAAFTPGAAAPASASSRPPIADVAAEASAHAALEEVTETLARARAEGRMIEALPLDRIDLTHLVRDRLVIDDAEMTALKASLASRGQQTPIEVEPLDDEGRYGLISGWRRCQALAALHAETGEARFGQVQALIRRPEDAPGAYLAMVEENEIRVGLSYFERASIALKATDRGVFETEKAALLALFGNASRAKRSKIRSFVEIVRHLSGALRFPAALGERLGLRLAKALQDDTALGPALSERLRASDVKTPEDEAAVLQAALKSTPKQALTQQTESKLPARTTLLGPGKQLVEKPDGSFVITGIKMSPQLRSALAQILRKHA